MTTKKNEKCHCYSVAIEILFIVFNKKKMFQFIVTISFLEVISVFFFLLLYRIDVLYSSPFVHNKHSDKSGDV